MSENDRPADLLPCEMDDATLALAFAFQTESARIALLEFARDAARYLKAEGVGLSGSYSLAFLHSAARLCAVALAPNITFVATTTKGAQGLSAWVATCAIACDVSNSLAVMVGRPGDVFPTPEQVHDMARRYATIENVDKALCAANNSPNLFGGQDGKRLYEAAIPAWKKTTEAFPSGCRLANDPAADGQLEAALADLRAELDGFDATSEPAPAEPEPIEAQADRLPDYVTLDQAAAAAHRGKRTLERRKTDGSLPSPSVEGGGGKPDLWEWPIIRPWLESEFGVKLPKRFPGNRR